MSLSLLIFSGNCSPQSKLQRKIECSATDFVKKSVPIHCFSADAVMQQPTVAVPIGDVDVVESLGMEVLINQILAKLPHF